MAPSRSGIAHVALGSAAPDFELESHHGTKVTLSGYRGDRHVVLFFLREFT